MSFLLALLPLRDEILRAVPAEGMQERREARMSHAWHKTSGSMRETEAREAPHLGVPPPILPC